MSETLKDFELNLRKQTDLYKKIIQLEKDKQHALVHNKIPEIETITAQEEKILLEVSRLDEERLLWAEFFGKQIGKRAEEITLNDIVAAYPSLDLVRQEFDREIAVLANLHETNTALLENAVSLVNFTIQSLTNERQATYSNPADRAKKEPSKKISIIDKSI